VKDHDAEFRLSVRLRTGKKSNGSTWGCTEILLGDERQWTGIDQFLREGRNMKKIAIALAATAALGACVETEETVTLRTGSSEAEFACAQAVNQNFGRAVATVTSSQFSEANTIVMLTAEGQRFRCLTSSDGVVAELASVN
jgi:hypothetical protein